MDDRDLTVLVGAGLSGLGAGFVAAPALVGRVWLGEEVRHTGVQVALRGLGARDLALGLGILMAHRRGAPVRGWLEATALAAAADAATTLLAWHRLPWGGRLAGTLPSAASAAVTASLAWRAGRRQV
ncbi:MAG TPA: hypothetical protein VHF25_09385 [Nitriliruptorales bacterium]|nr:hypothetical protein [Nitriliruptorales bacterium]